MVRFAGASTFSPRSHAAYLLAVYSCSSRHSSKSARVRLETNKAHGRLAYLLPCLPRCYAE